MNKHERTTAARTARFRVIGAAVAAAVMTVPAAALPAHADPGSAPAVIVVPSGVGPPDVLAHAGAAVLQNLSAVKGSSKDTFTAYSAVVDASGAAHVRYTRRYNGLRVSGGDLVVHTAADGAYAGVSVGLTASLALSTEAKVSAASAGAGARARFVGRVDAVGGSELFVDADSGWGRLAWETVVRGMAGDGQTPSVLHVISDATSGAFIGAFDEIETVVGTGKSRYSGTVSIDTTQVSTTSYAMIDPLHPGGYTCDMNNTTTTCTTFTDADNSWGNGADTHRQTAAVDAHFGATKTFDYYKNTHGRNGIFGDGTGVPSRVHYGNAFVNAFWNGSSMTYGDGAGNVRPLVSLDVVAHEMTHGVTSHVVPGGLTYSHESGGLNEATSDIFGSMVEFYAGVSADPGDYLIAEKINFNGDGTPMRYMYNPALDGVSHSCWSTTTKDLDVHNSSGVGNHFFFNLAEGTGNTSYGTSPLCTTMANMAGIGRTKAAKIWFRALNLYFVSNTTYVNTTNPGNTARAYTIQAAVDLYGPCSGEVQAVKLAWKAVNVSGALSPCGPVPDVRRKTQSEATQTLQASGFVVGQVQLVVDEFCRNIGRVISQTPVGGTTMPPGTPVDLRIGKLPAHPCP
jgi:Zn-dependent metalloprotease